MELERPKPERVVEPDELPPSYEASMSSSAVAVAPGVIPGPMNMDTVMTMAGDVDVDVKVEEMVEETQPVAIEEPEVVQPQVHVPPQRVESPAITQVEKKAKTLPRPPPDFKLWKNSREREKYDNLADLYAIIKTTEHLEKAYVRDSITAEEYEPACLKLISQFRTIRHTLTDTVPDVKQFMSEYTLDCPAAARRLIDVGVPATVEHGDVGQKAQDKENSQRILETGQCFITAMDALKVNLTAVDQLHPLLSDLVESLNYVPNLPRTYDGREKMMEWIQTLASMRAHDELDDDQIRQLSFDLERAYNGFHRALGEMRK